MSDAVGLQGYAGTEEPGKGNSAKPLVTSMSWHCMLQVASCQYPASERVADSSGSSCKDIPVCRWAGRFSMFVSATALLPSIDEGHAAARTVDCGLRTGTGSILFAREANAGSGRTRSANYLKMTPNYQCKVSWYHLPSANIPPKTREKEIKELRKWKFKHYPRFLCRYLLPGLNSPELGSRFDVAPLYIPFDSLPAWLAAAGCHFAVFGKKEISLTGIWLTLSQHKHIHSWAFGPNGPWHRCWRLLSMMKCTICATDITQTFGGILEDNVFVYSPRYCLLMMANWIGNWYITQSCGVCKIIQFGERDRRYNVGLCGF